MAENGASANGHRPARRRKHIYPPLEQMAAEQAASVERRLAGSGSARSAVKDVTPEATPPPAPPVVPVQADAGATNGTRTKRRRKRIYPPGDQMAAEQAAARGRRAPKAITVAPSAESALTADVDDGTLEADRVELRLSAVGMVDAGDIQFAQGALGAARAENVSVEQGALGAALADKVEVSQGYARSILARHVQLDSAAARMVVAADVKVQRSAVMVLIARKVSGDVRVLLDWRGAVAFGAVAGIIGGAIARARRR